MTTATSIADSAMLPRFDRIERAVHWMTATLLLVLLATGFSLYVGPLSTLVGRRVLVRNIHVYSGLLLPIPVLVAIVMRAGAQLRADLGRLNRWTRDDRAWWRRRRRATARLGKFNPGQKLNATFIGASIVVMLMTGSIMRWFEPFSDSWRQGATFVHDWFAIGLLFAIAGHILLAFRDPDALNGMVRGSVRAGWAAKYRPRWYEEVLELRGDGGVGRVGPGPAGDTGARVEEHGRERALRAGEVAVVDRVDGGTGDGVGEREL
jgi:formate dehydrogenase subunit gamma